MRTLYFDTETTNFTEHSSFHHQPGLIQIGAILVDDLDNSIINKLFCWTFPINHKKECLAEEVDKSPWHRDHELTSANIIRYGINQDAVLTYFTQLVRKADRIVAHNIAFDWPVYLANYIRTFDVDIRNNLPKVDKLCTMQSIIKYTRIGNLERAYQAFVDPNGFPNAHNAFADTIACWKLGQYIEKTLQKPLLRGYM